MSEILKNKRIAVVLMNLGGPSDLDSVEKFLFNLFYDPAIIQLSNPIRWIVAKMIAKLRNKKAQKIYSHIGNRSPLLIETDAQKKYLLEKLNKEIQENNLKLDIDIFICMRYWHPMSDEVSRMIFEYNPEEIILLPLYPQFSTTTTGSSINNFLAVWQQKKSMAKIKTVCCYYDNSYFINSHTKLIQESIQKLEGENFRILFSAHGLPVKIIKNGDPYQWQVEKTVENIIQKLEVDNVDYKVTYQSKVGPVEWLKPNTEDEIRIAGVEKIDLIIVPIAFVSEHVETLVELDMEYAEIAKEYQIQYIRVPTLRTNKIFIEALSEIVLKHVLSTNDLENKNQDMRQKQTCPPHFTRCYCHAQENSV
jgi:ferrochelatase